MPKKKAIPEVEIPTQVSLSNAPDTAYIEDIEQIED